MMIVQSLTLQGTFSELTISVEKQYETVYY